MDFFKPDLSNMLRGAAQSVAPVFDELLAHHPEGLRALLAYWQLLSLPEGSPDCEALLDQVLTHMKVEDVAAQALYSGGHQVIEALAARGVRLGALAQSGADKYALEQLEDDDWVPRHEIFVVAQQAADADGEQAAPPIGLARLAQLDPGRPGCIKAPAAGNTTSWLALSLMTNQRSQAELIWQQRLSEGKEWTVEERAEAALAWFASAEEWAHDPNPSSLGVWWDRLMAPEVAFEPVQIKAGWARRLETHSELRFKNLKGHVESALIQAQKGESADMVGVLLRTLDMSSDVLPTARPVDMALLGLAQIPAYDQDLAELLKRVRAFDWGSVQPDAQGRGLAIAALEVGFSHPSRSGQTQALSLLWGKAIPALPEMDKDMWWSLASSMALRGYTLPLKDAVSHFKGRFDLEHHQGVLLEAGELVEDRARHSSFGSSQDSLREAKAIASRFWEEVALCLAASSNAVPACTKPKDEGAGRRH